VKQHCQKRNIQLIVIPGVTTPYLQAGDIGIYREFKDHLLQIINARKSSTFVEYTSDNNPKPPGDEVLRSWLLDAWRQAKLDCIHNSIKSAGFADSYQDWHISRHDVYGDQFRTAWENSGPVEPDVEALEAIEQDDELYDGYEVSAIDDEVSAIDDEVEEEDDE
jgi:hypothetical protein